ncbi:hypothetical protein HZA99_03620 [Candidatus Woesearchaeota archaeon]|nr:hypothetical protein [Candidatus Woesearchaeota archaeon]
MVVKTLTVTEDSYNKMKRLKKEDESFSDLFNRIADEKLNVASRFLGLVKLSPSEMDAWRKNTARNKKLSSLVDLKKQTKLEKRMRELGM